MSIKTVPLDDLVVVLRRPFEAYSDGNGSPIADKNGQPQYVAEAVIPGALTSRYNLDDKPDLVRVKIAGTQPSMTAPAVVRLIGARLTSWYQPRARGSDARSDVTVTVERVEVATGQAPATRGGLPAHLAGVAAMFLGQNADGIADVMIEASGSFVVDGLAEVRCSSTVPLDLIGQTVRLEQLRAFYAAPDREDVSARSKAELVLACTAIVRADAAPTSNGRAKREPVTVPADPTPSEG